MFRIGTGFDVHAFTNGKKLFLCGIEIPFDKGLKGHSDADVALHALTDSILGALALGDIGRWFPDNDPLWKNASSSIFVKKAIQLGYSNGFSIGNIDMTIICQKPKISEIHEHLVTSVSEICEVEKNKVNIKGTTTEHLGFTGREEGIASICTVLLNENK
tara:strand:- start:173 stop:652 length:480 start_codon:yes stop_codon:yes gene_type:complete